jgi:FkbM family methyltransferase
MLVKLMQSALASLPDGAQFAFRRVNYARQIRRKTFILPDPEIAEITRHLREGDWVVDVGANIGRYTAHMGACVGRSGRVLAFEPVAVSFALLAANVRATGLRNVTLFNVALSSAAGVSSMTVPAYEDSTLDNYYRAHISDEGEHPVMCLPLDAIPIPKPVRLVKIDAEGHDLQVLRGMEALLQKDRPILIVEGWPDGPAASWLQQRGYSVRRLANSPNIVATPSGVTAAMQLPP